MSRVIFTEQSTSNESTIQYQSFDIHTGMAWNYEKSAKFIAYLQAITGFDYKSNMGQLMNQVKRIALHNNLDAGLVHEELVKQTQKLADSNFNPLDDLVHEK